MCADPIFCQQVFQCVNRAIFAARSFDSLDICSDMCMLHWISLPLVALKWNGHLNWCANKWTFAHVYYYCYYYCFLTFFSSIYSIAFIACNYDPLNTFAKLIVKTLKCHFELHIKVSLTHFLFRLKVFKWFLCISEMQAFELAKAASKSALHRWKYRNLYSTSIKYEYFYLNFQSVLFLSSALCSVISIQ